MVKANCVRPVVEMPVHYGRAGDHCLEIALSREEEEDGQTVF